MPEHFIFRSPTRRCSQVRRDDAGEWCRCYPDRILKTGEQVRVRAMGATLKDWSKGDECLCSSLYCILPDTDIMIVETTKHPKEPR
jgi:hypothetical protein